MAFQHGVYILEKPSELQYAISTSLGVLVAIGTAPTFSAEDPQEFALCHTIQDAEKYLGDYTENWDKYTLNEVVYSHFFQYNISPLVCINVLDKDKHYTALPTKTVSNVTTETKIAITKETIKSSVIITSTATIEDEEVTTTLLQGIDWEFSTEGDSIEIKSVSRIQSGTIEVNLREYDATKVTSADIIAGIQKVSEVYSRFQLVPSLIISPKWSQQSEVIAAMKVAATSEYFNAISIVDIPTNTPYSSVASVKQSLNINDSHVICCYPKIALGGVEYHLSTQLASLMLQVAIRNDQIPYESPSNKSLQMDSCIGYENGTFKEVYYTREQANYLNGLGVVTALNFAGGWKAWGNRTSCYPNNSDVKDNMIPIRFMFNWIGNNLVVNYWSQIDSAMTRRFIDSAVNSARIWIAGLVASGALIDGDVEFVESDNSLTNLANGQLRFRVTITPPSAAEVITFVQQYDANALTQLFSSEE